MAGLSLFCMLRRTLYLALTVLLLGSCLGDSPKRPDLVDEDKRLQLYWPDSSKQFFPNAFCALQNGGFAITGRAQDSAANRRDFILLLDKKGAISSFRYLEPVQQRDAMGRLFIYRGTEGMAILEAPNGDILVASKAIRGNIEHQNSLLRLLSPDGKTRRWGMALNTIFRTSPRALAHSNEKEFVLVENIIDLPAAYSPSGRVQNTDEIQVHRIRYDKLTVWSKRFSSRKQQSQLAYDIAVVQQENSLVLGASQTQHGYEYLLITFDPRGQPTQAIVFDFSFLRKGNRAGYSLATCSDGYLLMGGLELGETLKHQLFKLDPVGDTLWHRDVPGSPRSYPQVGEAPNGLYLLAGATLAQEAYGQFYEPDGTPLRQDRLVNLGYAVEVRDLQWQNQEAYLLGNAQHPDGRQIFIWKPRIPSWEKD